jgi:PKD repeat protein
MKKRLHIILLILFTATSIHAQQRIQLQTERSGLTIHSNSGLSFTGNFVFSEMIAEQKQTPAGSFTEIHLPDFTFRYNDGNPSIPVYSRLIEIPGLAEVVIQVKSYTTQTIQLSDYGIYDKIIPAQPTYSKSTDPEDIIFVYNETAYQVNDFSQGELISVEYQGMARGVGVAQLLIDPVRYNPATNQLLIFNNIVFEITFQPGSYSQYLEEKDRVYSPLFNSLYNKLPNFIFPPEKDLITQYPIKYVIVSPPMFRDSLEKFVQWKTQKGFRVIEAYTDNPAVGTTSASIKTYLQGLYNSATPEDPPPTFVLIVGDVAQIPAFAGTAGSHPSDMYYVEYTGGGDYIPEAYIGRFSATTISQLMPQINKTLLYEKFTMPVSTYMDTVVMIAGVDGTFAITHGNGQINYGTNNYFNSSNGIFSHTYLYPTSNESWVDADMRQKVGKGAGLANYTAHCNETGWGDPTFSNSHIPQMANLNKYGLMIGNCCLSNKFDYSECFGEAMLRVPNKGAVGYLGGSNNTYWNEDFWWGVGYTATVTANPTYSATGLGAYDRVFHDHGELYADWFVTNSQINYGGNLAVQASTTSLKKYYWEIYHVMGDPSVMTYLWNPDPLFMNYSAPLIVGDQSLLVNCEPFTLVALSVNNQLLDAQFSGAGNSVTLQFSSITSTGTALIVGTKQNRAPQIHEIDIEEINMPVDAQIMQIQNIQNNYTCTNMNIQPIVILRNKGFDPLTQVNIHYQWNNGQVQQINWSGNLSTLDTAQIILPPYLVTVGSHELMVFSDNPNGLTDGNTSNDTLIKAFYAQNLPLTAVFSTAYTEFCSPPATVQFTNNSLNAFTYLWDFGDGNYSSQQNPTHQYTTVGLYSVSLTAFAGICGSDQMTIQDYILVGAEPPAASSQSNCGPASFTLTATALSDVNWYDDPAGTNLIHTGNSLTTPFLNVSTTYFAGTEIHNSYFGGRPDNSGTGGYYTSTAEQGLVFSCTAPTTLKSVKVYFGGSASADRTIKLMSGSSLLQSIIVNIPPGESRITLNLNIPAGTNLKLTCPANPNLFRNGSQTMNIGYPMQVGNNISILQSTASGYETNYYYYFYDWEVEETCKSPLIPVNAYVQTTPVSDFSFISNGYLVTFTNLSTGGGGADYLWDFGDGITSALENPAHFYGIPGLYDVSLQTSNTCGTHTEIKQVNVIAGIHEIQSNVSLIIYPNPVSGMCMIESDRNIKEIQVFDLTGKLLFHMSGDSPKISINLTGFAGGSYLLRATTDEDTIQRKLLIQ